MVVQERGKEVCMRIVGRIVRLLQMMRFGLRQASAGQGGKSMARDRSSGMQTCDAGCVLYVAHSALALPELGLLVTARNGRRVAGLGGARTVRAGRRKQSSNRLQPPEKL